MAIPGPSTSNAGLSPLALPPPLPGEYSRTVCKTKSFQEEARDLFESRNGKSNLFGEKKLYSVSIYYDPRTQFIQSLLFTINIGFSQPELEVKEEELNRLEHYLAIRPNGVSFQIKFPDRREGVSQESMIKIARAMNHLANGLKFNPLLEALSYFSLFHVDYISPLQGHPFLSFLGISRLELDPEALLVLTATICSLNALKTLRMIGLNENETGVIIPRVLENLTGLSSLELPNSRLNPDAVSAISHNLLHSTQLQHLDLQNAQGDFIQAFEALYSNFTLMGLEIAGVPLNVEQSAALAKMLQSNNALNSLSLTFAHETRDEALVPVISALRVNRALGSLKIKETAQFGKEAFSHVLPSLLVNATLVDLEMPGSTRDVNLEIFGRVLAVNSTLRRLQLISTDQNPNINQEHVCTFAAGLMSNSTLNSLHIGGFFEQNSEKLIFAALTQNFVLTSFLPYTDPRNSQFQCPLKTHVLRNAENAPQRQASLFGLLMGHPPVVEEMQSTPVQTTDEKQ